MSDILSHTPIWIWVILFLLVRRGFAALQPERISIARLFILPLVMIGWSLYALTTQMHDAPAALAGFVGIGLIVTVIMHRRIRLADGLVLERGTMTLLRPGMPAILIVSIGGFGVRYALGVEVATNPWRVGDVFFTTIYGTMSGLVSGAALGLATGQVAAALRPAYSNFTPRFGRQFDDI
ncbi:DUF6622 family protein [Nguyenibacter vanlangensis]|uniref:DUF6622 family protein n=1 Tax=Nguyenibacter vanlangensis TaxID=1216886 RepID=A0ABZ3D2Z0_9PROT